MLWILYKKALTWNDKSILTCKVYSTVLLAHKLILSRLVLLFRLTIKRGCRTVSNGDPAWMGGPQKSFRNNLIFIFVILSAIIEKKIKYKLCLSVSCLHYMLICQLPVRPHLVPLFRFKSKSGLILRCPNLSYVSLMYRYFWIQNEIETKIGITNIVGCERGSYRRTSTYWQGSIRKQVSLHFAIKWLVC